MHGRASTGKIVIILLIVVIIIDFIAGKLVEYGGSIAGVIDGAENLVKYGGSCARAQPRTDHVQQEDFKKCREDSWCGGDERLGERAEPEPGINEIDGVVEGRRR